MTERDLGTEASLLEQIEELKFQISAKDDMIVNLEFKVKELHALINFYVDILEDISAAASGALK